MTKMQQAEHASKVKSTPTGKVSRGVLRDGLSRFKSQIMLQIIVIPGIIWLIVFCYLPMYGISIAFRDYKVSEGFFNGAWVGFKHFEAFFADGLAIRSIKNTLFISLYKLVFGFPAPIIFALLLNELRSLRYKKIIQTVSYLPYFISWVVLASIMFSLLNVEGSFNQIFITLGITDHKISFLGDPRYFRFIAVVSDIWKGIGWNSIIYIAAISSVPQEMYEAAYIDGASRWQRVFRVTVPSILPTIVILLILSVSGILGSNFEQHLLLGNNQTLSVADTIDTYVFRTGISRGRYSFATAISLSRSILAFLLLFGADRLARYISKGEQGIF